MNEMLYKNKLCSVVSEVIHLLTIANAIMYSFELNICHRWLLGITKYGIVQWQSVYDDLVMVYAYCDTPLWQIL